MQGSSSSTNNPETLTKSEGDATPSVGRFRVLRPLAKGGIGQVSVALDEELQRQVALKELQTYHADNPESRARFVSEAEITGRLEHPGIVPVYGLGFQADGRPYYAMRLIHGETLRETIRRFHRGDGLGIEPGDRLLARNQLLRRFISVCDAVHYAHSRGIVHRDIKPGNIMLGPYGETLLVDWGLAKLASEQDRFLISEGKESSEQDRLPIPEGKESPPVWDTRLVQTHEGAFVGTPQYASPEQAAGIAERIGPASDIYSLGATLFTILTDRAPFEDEQIQDVLNNVRLGRFPRPTQVNSRVPKLLEAICLRAMAPLPRGRYKTARELAEDVERFLSGEPIRTKLKPPEETPRPPTIRISIRGDGGTLHQSVPFAGPVELGRQRKDSEQVFSTQRIEDRVRFVIVGRGELRVSRELALLTPLENATLQIKNLGKLPLQTRNHGELIPGEERMMQLPVEMIFSQHTIRTILIEEASQESLSALVPENDSRETTRPADELTTIVPVSVPRQEFARWGQVVADLTRKSVSRSDLFNQTAQHLLSMIGLDLAAVLLADGDDWKVQAVKASREGDAVPEINPRPSVLAAIRSEKCAVWQTPTQEEDVDWSSIQDMRGIIAAPIMDEQGNVVGAIYGERTIASLPTSHQMKLESVFMGLVAALIGPRVVSGT